MNVSIPCDVRDGGGYGFCRDEYLPMNGEGIFVVLKAAGDKEPVYIYDLYYPLGSENTAS
jgi:hypothetical protein